MSLLFLVFWIFSVRTSSNFYPFPKNSFQSIKLWNTQLRKLDLTSEKEAKGLKGKSCLGASLPGSDSPQTLNYEGWAREWARRETQKHWEVLKMKRITNNITHPAVHITLQCNLWLPLTLMDHSKPPFCGFWCYRWLTLSMECLHYYYHVHQFYTFLHVEKTVDEGHIEWTGQPQILPKTMFSQWLNFSNCTCKWGTKGHLSKQSFWIPDYIINLAIREKWRMSNVNVKCWGPNTAAFSIQCQFGATLIPKKEFHPPGGQSMTGPEFK